MKKAPHAGLSERLVFLGRRISETVDIGAEEGGVVLKPAGFVDFGGLFARVQEGLREKQTLIADIFHQADSHVVFELMRQLGFADEQCVRNLV